MDKTGPVLYGTRRFVPLLTTAAIAAPPEPYYSSQLLISHFFITIYLFMLRSWVPYFLPSRFLTYPKQLIIDCLYVLRAQPISNPLMWSRDNICWVQILKLLIMYFFPDFYYFHPLSSTYCLQQLLPWQPHSLLLFENTWSFMTMQDIWKCSLICFYTNWNIWRLTVWAIEFQVTIPLMWFDLGRLLNVMQILSDLLLSDWYFAAYCGNSSEPVNKCCWHMDAMLCDFG